MPTLLLCQHYSLSTVLVMPTLLSWSATGWLEDHQCANTRCHADNTLVPTLLQDHQPCHGRCACGLAISYIGNVLCRLAISYDEISCLQAYWQSLENTFGQPGVVSETIGYYRENIAASKARISNVHAHAFVHFWRCCALWLLLVQR